MSTITRDNLGRVIGFVMPSPVALALDIATQAANRADEVRGSLTFVDNVTPIGKSKGVSQEQCGHLYDFFEHCMIAVTFSMNALEIYCNQVIADSVKGQKYRRTTGKRDQELDADQLQRIAPVEEKLTIVLPTLLSVETPTNIPQWSQFKILKEARDSTIHMKARDAYPRPESADDIGRVESLFHQFFKRKTMRAFPQFAADIIDHLRAPGTAPPRWLTLLQSKGLT